LDIFVLNETLTGIWNLESNQETSATCLDLLDEHQKYQEIQETSQRRGFSRPAERRILTDPILSFCLKFCFNNIQYTHMDRSFLTEFYDVFIYPFPNLTMLRWYQWSTRGYKLTSSLLLPIVNVLAILYSNL